ncbi:MAG: WXG100 family type VII secretion target [Lachnospiraceae bacterium]|nr:WXG100 family type VII secretion target [Lachnospiraceae bacterium]
MGASASLQMSYDDMQAEITKLTQYVEEFEATTRSMTNSVTALCDGWVSASTEAYREDYTALANNFTHTQEIVRSLIQSTNDYIKEMKAVDAAFSKSKVSVG